MATASAVAAATSYLVVRKAACLVATSSATASVATAFVATAFVATASATASATAQADQATTNFSSEFYLHSFP